MQVQVVRRRILWGCVALALFAGVLWYRWEVEASLLLEILLGALAFTVVFALAGTILGGLLMGLRWWLAGNRRRRD